MKLLNYKTTDRYFIIETDQGERKVSLKWHGIDNIINKSQELIGKNIKLSTWGDWDPLIWFQDINKDNIFLENNNNVNDVNSTKKDHINDDQDWNSIITLIDQKYHEIINILKQNNCPVPFDLEVELTKDNKILNKKSILSWKSTKNKDDFIHMLDEDVDNDDQFFVINNVKELNEKLPSILNLFIEKLK